MGIILKAIEYYNQYGQPIMDEVKRQSKTHQAMQSFLIAFGNESIRIMQTKKPKNDAAVVAVFKQQNEKWNQICHLIEQHYGYTPIKRNAYWNIMKREIKGLAQAEVSE